MADLIQLIVALIVVGLIASLLGLPLLAGTAFQGASLVFTLLIVLVLVGVGIMVWRSVSGGQSVNLSI
jgi:uncharacterized membrane protein YtjA (UPF0391 family)